MKFRLRRTSQPRPYVEPPIPGAYRQAQVVEPEGHDDGNHWFVDVESLDELLALVAREGRIIVGFAPDDVVLIPTVPTIEIYDDYRE